MDTAPGRNDYLISISIHAQTHSDVAISVVECLRQKRKLIPTGHGTIMEFLLWLIRIEVRLDVAWEERGRDFLGSAV